MLYNIMLLPRCMLSRRAADALIKLHWWFVERLLVIERLLVQSSNRAFCRRVFGKGTEDSFSIWVKQLSPLWPSLAKDLQTKPKK